jgi:hypothetical protein
VPHTIGLFVLAPIPVVFLVVLMFWFFFLKR